MHEIGRINGRKVFQSGNAFQICKNKFYDQKNDIPMKIPGVKRSGIHIIAEFCRIELFNQGKGSSNGGCGVGIG